MGLPEPYYQDASCTIYHGDCLVILPELKADVVITDPPYGLNFPYLTYQDSRESLKALLAEAMPLLAGITDSIFVLCGPTQITLYPKPEWVASVTWDTTGSLGRYGYNQWTLFFVTARTFAALVALMVLPRPTHCELAAVRVLAFVEISVKATDLS